MQLTPISRNLELQYLLSVVGFLLLVVASGVLYRNPWLFSLCSQAIRVTWEACQTRTNGVRRAYRKHVAYQFLIPRAGRFRGITREHAFLGTAIVVANVVAITLPFSPPNSAITRAGLLAMVNLIPLLISPAGLAVMLFNVSRVAQRQLHVLFATIIFVEVSLHALPPVIHGDVAVRETSMIFGITGTSAVLILTFGSLPLFRRLSYEIFIIGHRVIAWGLPLTLWYHCKAKTASEEICIYTLLGTIGVSSACWLCRLLYRNVSYRGGWTAAEVMPKDRAICLEVSVPSQWRVMPGQYVYLTVPRASLTSLMQRHPFMICSSRPAPPGLTGLSISLIAEERSGFTRRLTGLSPGKHTAFVDGPYGMGLDIRNFDAVLLVASGVGIVNYILWLQTLATPTRGKQRSAVNIRLLWVLERESQLQWVSAYIDEHLEEISTRANLRITLFGPEAMREKQKHSKEIRFFKCALSTVNEKIIKAVNKVSSHPKALVSVSSDATLSNFVRSTVITRLTAGLRFHEMDFSPAVYLPASDLQDSLSVED